MTTDWREREDGTKGPDPLAKTHGGSGPRGDVPPSVSRGARRGETRGAPTFHQLDLRALKYAELIGVTAAIDWLERNQCATQADIMLSERAMAEMNDRARGKRKPPQE